MAAKQEDLIIEQGATFLKTVSIKNGDVAFDLTGYTVRGQIRTGATSPDIIATFSGAVKSPETDGILTIELDKTITSNLVTTGDKFNQYTKLQYDVEIESPTGFVYRILNGAISVSPNQTK